MSNKIELIPEYIIEGTRKYWKVRLDANKTIAIEDGILSHGYYDKNKSILHSNFETTAVERNQIGSILGITDTYKDDSFTLRIAKAELFNWHAILIAIIDIFVSQQDTTAKYKEQKLNARDVLKSLRAFSAKLEQEAQEDFFSILEYPEKALEISEEAQAVVNKVKAFNNKLEQERQKEYPNLDKQEDEVDTLLVLNNSSDLQNKGMSLEIDMIWKELSKLASNIQYVCMENKKTDDRLEEICNKPYKEKVHKLEAALNKVDLEFKKLENILCEHTHTINQLKKSPTNSIAQLYSEVQQLKKLLNYKNKQ